MGLLLKSKPSLPQDQGFDFDKDMFYEELEYLRVIVLIFKLSEIGIFGKKTFSARDVGYVVSQAYLLSSQDIGAEKETVKEKSNNLAERIGEYEEYLHSIDKKTINSRGTYFYLLTHFSGIVVARPKGSGGGMESFDVFDLGKQVFRNDEKALKSALANVEFLD